MWIIREVIGGVPRASIVPYLSVSLVHQRKSPLIHEHSHWLPYQQCKSVPKQQSLRLKILCKLDNASHSVWNINHISRSFYLSITEKSPTDAASHAPKQENNFPLVSHLQNKFQRKQFNSWQQLLLWKFQNFISWKASKEIRPLVIYNRARK